MRIALVSSNESRGGAARVAYCVVAQLRLRGHTVDHFVERKDHGQSAAILYTAGGLAANLADDVMHRLGRAYTPGWRGARRRRAQAGLRRLLERGNYDAIHVHGFNTWSYPGLERRFVAGLAEVAPVVWTLHDLWPLTGCCEYRGDCRRGEACGWEKTHRAARGGGDADVDALLAAGKRLCLAAPSRWMAGEARDALAGRVRVDVVPNGVDQVVYAPFDAAAARAALALPVTGRLLLAVADSLEARRKGVALLYEAVAALPDDVHLAMVGLGHPPSSLGRRAHALGLVNDERLLRLAYAAADAVVVPSLEDNLPNVLLEGLACGRPLVGFRIGGVPDVIEPGVTGELAERTESGHLAEAIGRVLAWRGAADVVARCRARAERDYTLDRQAAAYESLFRELMVAGT